MASSRLLVLAGALLAICRPAPGADHTFVVNTTADGVDANPGDGTCATSGGQCTLRAAIMEGNHTASTDTVEIVVPASASAYVLTIFPSGTDDETTGNLNVDHTMTITGGGAAHTIIDGNGADNVFAIATGSFSGPSPGVVLADLTVRNGLSTYSGGGIYATQHVGTLTLTRCVVTGNTAQNGGGILSEAITTIERSTFSDNAATMSGGGIYSAGSLTLADSTVSGNTAPLAGGGIYSFGTDLTIYYSTISGNTVGTFGSGIMPVGGGVWSYPEATPTVTGTIIGVNLAWIPSAPPYSTLVYSDCSGTFAGARNLVNDTTGCTIPATVADPMLGDLHPNGGSVPTRALLPGSPAIDAGSPTSCAFGTPTDERGAHRPEGTACDLGAYEYDANGDVNGDGKRDVADVFYLINFLFAGGPAPMGLGDVNGDATTDVADVFALVNFLFAGGPAPL